MLKVLTALCLLSWAAWGQQTKIAPDCTLSFALSSASSTGSLDNRSTSQITGVPCTLWALTWSAQPAVTSLTINIEGAPDSGGSPGSFASLASATTFPSGKIDYSASTAYSPWMRVTISAIGTAGLVNGVLNGWREDQSSIGGGGGGGGGCAGTVGEPCVIGGTNGSAQTIIVGTIETQITLSAGTDVVIVAGTSGKTSYIPKFDMSWDNNADVTVREGTGTTCLSSTTALAGPYKNLVALFEDYGGFAPLHATATGLDICLHFSTSVTGGGQSFAAQF
jgi:hypothetical protein